MPNSNDLLILKIILEDPHLTRASARLNLTQSALSHILGRLRTHLNDPLFVKTGRTLVPTNFLLSLEPHLHELEKVMERINLHSAHFDPATTRYNFTLNLPELVSIPLVPRLVEHIGSINPNIKFSFLSLNPEAGLQALRDKKIDLYIGNINKNADEFKTQLLYKEKFVCVCLAKSKLITQGKISRTDYLSANHLKLSIQGERLSHIDQALSKLGYTREIQTTLPFYLMGLEILRTKNLLMTAPKSMIQHMHLHSQYRFATAPFPFPIDPLPISQYWHPSTDQDPAFVWLRKQLKIVGDSISKDLI